jgi:hypothetical protein
VGPKLRFKLCDFVELLSGEGATQCRNCFFEVFCTLSTRNGVVCEALSTRKGLSPLLGGWSFRARRAFPHGEKGVGEIAPGVELVRANTYGRLHCTELHRKKMWTVAAMFMVSVSMSGQTFTLP